MLSQTIFVPDGGMGFAALISAVIFLFVFIAISFHLLHETPQRYLVQLGFFW